MLVPSSICPPSLQLVLGGQGTFIKNGSDDSSEHFCGHRGPTGERRANRGDSRGSSAPSLLGGLLELYFPLFWVEPVFSP